MVLLERGQVTLSEAAELAGVSRQLVYAWCRRAGIDWKVARQQRLEREWLKAERSNMRPRKKPSKRDLRRLADASKVSWDLSHEQDGQS